MRLRPAVVLMGTGLVVCAVAVLWQLSLDADAPATVAIEPAPNARSITLHFNGEAVGTVTPDELRERQLLIDFLPKDARDISEWKVLRAQGDRLAHFDVENPAERIEERDVCLYLLEGGWPSIGVFRRLDDSMSASVREQLSRPGLFLGKVRTIYVWTVDRPVPVSSAGGPSLEVVVEDGGKPAKVTAARIATLPAIVADGDRAHEGRHLLDVVGLVTQAERVDNVRLENGTGTPVDVPRRWLRAPGVKPLLRVNRRGLWAFDMAGTTDADEPAGGRMRGVLRLVVTLGAAQPLPTERVAATEAPVTARPNVKPSPDEKLRMNALLELSRLAPDTTARAQVMLGLRDESEFVRLRAVRSLVYWDDCVPDLYDHLQNEPSVEIQRTCLKTIGRRGTVEYIEDLGEWAQGRSKRVLKEVDKARRRIAERAGVEPPEQLVQRRR